MVSGSKVINFDKANKKGFEMLSEGDKFGFLIICGVNLGLRVSDLTKITYNQLKQGSFVIGEQKTKKKRKIIVNSNVKAALNIMSELDYWAYKRGGSPFVSQKNKVYSRQHINRRLNKIFGEGHSSHGLRKGFGRRLFEVKSETSGRDGALAVVQMTLQHSNPGDTLRYIGVTQDMLDQCYVDIV